MEKLFTLLLTIICLFLAPCLTSGQNCDPDVTPPTAVCLTGVTAQVESGTGEAAIWTTDIDAGSLDLCGEVTLALSLPGATEPTSTESLNFTVAGSYIVILWVTDESGNYNSCWTEVIIQGSGTDCDEDTTPPIAQCASEITVGTAPVTVPAPALDDGSYDLCSPVEFRVSPAGTAAEPPSETSISFSVFGSYLVDLWVLDEAGNWSTCQSTVTVPDFADPCANDEMPPLAVCIDEATVALNEATGEYILYAEDVDEGSWDNCGALDLRLGLEPPANDPPATTSLTFSAPGTYTVTLWVIDQAGNWTACWSEITVLDTGENCQGDTEAPAPSCLDGLIAELSGFEDTVDIWATDVLFDVTDNCSELFNYGIELGDGSTQPPAAQSLTFDAPGTYTVTAWAGDEAGNWDYCTTDLVVVDNPNPVKRITGAVFQDDNASCAYETGEPYLEGWQVEVIPYLNGELSLGNKVEKNTLAEGSYQLDLPEVLINSADSFELRLALALNLSQACPLTYTVPASEFNGVSEITQDFAPALEEECYALQVDVAAPFLRRCFNSTYTISYCNYGAETAEDAYVEISLDDYLDYTNSSIAYSAVEGNIYTFPLGDIAPGDCSSFNLQVNVSCDAVLGQTHCTEAHIYPDQPCDGNYTGPEILVEGFCDESSEEVHFTITNIGEESMPISKNYFVVEDVIMYMQNPYSLDSGESLEVPSLPGNGATYRLEAEQPDEYPWLGITGATVEGCGTDGQGNVSLGIVTQFSTLEAGAFTAVDCQQNQGAWDPNDKQASPRGVGAEQLIRENTPIDYKIRFQNTGTDTAFTVVVMDTLSEWLEPASVRPGASSHSYTFSLLEDNILEFRFEHIMLPDSNVNVEASNGYVQFEVDQLPNNPEGTLIENQAAIYFDFNEPILTNTVWHTVGDLFINVNTKEQTGAEQLKVYPNPASESVRIEWEGSTGGIFQLFDHSGRLCREKRINSDTFDLSLNGLNTGLYLFKISSKNGQWYSGKITITR